MAAAAGPLKQSVFFLRNTVAQRILVYIEKWIVNNRLSSGKATCVLSRGIEE